VSNLLLGRVYVLQSIISLYLILGMVLEKIQLASHKIFWISMGRIMQDYPAHSNWRNAVVVVGGYNVWLSLHCTWVDLTSVPLNTSMGRIVTQLHATTVTNLFAKTTIWLLLCSKVLVGQKSFLGNSNWDAELISWQIDFVGVDSMKVESMTIDQLHASENMHGMYDVTSGCTFAAT